VVFASTEAAASQARLLLVNKLQQPKFNDSLRLDVFQAAQASAEPAIQAALQRYLDKARSPEQWAAPGLPYELLIAGGDSSRGRTLAQEHLAANCVACHRFESDEGSEVGPLLKKVGEQRTPAELAESLVNPSAKVVPGFGFETLTLRSGEVLAGSVVSETKVSLRLRQPDGTLKDVAVSAVVSRTPPVSMMPPMLGILKPAEVRDVVAYLASLKTKAPKAKK
jgi:quinoprotein glucose dehydrogenase